MKTAHLQLLGSISDFAKGKQFDEPEIAVTFELTPSAKDLLERNGIPHTAVYKLTVNKTEQKLTYNVSDGDHLQVYPYEFADPESTGSIYLTPASFVADVHLFKLSKTLRLLGLDTVCNRHWKDNQIIRKSNREQRMILTRDLGLLKHGNAKFGYWIRSTDPRRQIYEILDRFNIRRHFNPFSRCLLCNGILEEVPVNEVRENIPPKALELHNRYIRCNECGNIYWKGSHYQKLKKKVDTLIAYDKRRGS